jgi:hypothetical protein
MIPLTIIAAVLLCFTGDDGRTGCERNDHESLSTVCLAPLWLARYYNVRKCTPLEIRSGREQERRLHCSGSLVPSGDACQ